MTFQPHYHLGIVVQDIESAMLELGQALEMQWTSVETLELPEGSLRYTYSREGPPHIELLSGPQGSPWDASSGSHMHHIGLWSEDMEADRRRWQALGLQLEVDGSKIGRRFAYYTSAHGLRIEIVDSARRERMEDWMAGRGDFPT